MGKMTEMFRCNPQESSGSVSLYVKRLQVIKERRTAPSSFLPCCESRPMLSITTLVFPSCPDLLLEEITREGQTLFLMVRSSKQAMACPDCANVSRRVHSHYPR